MVNNAELNQKEVKHRTFGGHDSVNLSGFVDLFFSIQGNKLLLLNLIRSLLGNLKGLDKGSILKNGGWISIRKILEKIRLELGKSDLILVLFANEIFFSLFKIWLFNLDDHCKKLVFETGFSYNKVNDCALSSSFWLVMWVDEFGLEIQGELVGDFNIFTS